MLFLNGQIWSIHPLAISAAREAAQRQEPSESKPGKRKRAANEVLSLNRELSVDELPLEMHNGTAIVAISDLIVSWASYDYCSHPGLQQTFRLLAEQQPKNGVVLLIDTPGGMTKGSAETIDALNALQDSGVTVTAQVKGGCFSMGYKLASQCRGGIYCHRMDEVGSIGTKMVLEDYSEYFAKHGIEVVPITNDGATFKTLGEIGLPITDEQRAFLSEHVEQVFTEFRRCVQDGRQLTDDQFAEVSDGRWWLPEEAQRLGLIDGVRTLNETLASMQPASRLTPLREESDMSKATEAAAAKEAADKAAAEKQAADKAAAEKAEADKAAAEKAVADKAAAEKAAADKTEEKPPKQMQELQKWAATFGAENGTQWFLDEACDYTQACERHIAAQKQQLEAAQSKAEEHGKLLKEVSEQLGQLDPLQLERKEAKEEAGSGKESKGKSIAEIMSMRGAAK